MAEITLTAEPAAPPARARRSRLRAEGKVPAVVYGQGTDPIAVAVDWRELRARPHHRGRPQRPDHPRGRRRRRSSRIVKELQRHPVRQHGRPTSTSCARPRRGITVEVPVLLEGEAERRRPRATAWSSSCCSR